METHFDNDGCPTTGRYQIEDLRGQRLGEVIASSDLEAIEIAREQGMDDAYYADAINH